MRGIIIGRNIGKVFGGLALAIGLGFTSPHLFKAIEAQAGTNFQFIGNACTFPPTYTPYVRFRADQYTGSGSSLSMTKLGSTGNNATVVGGANGPTIVSGVINNQPVMRFSAASSQYLIYAANTVAITNKDTAHDYIVVSQAAGATPGSPGFEVQFSYCVDSGASKKSQIFASANFANYKPWYWGGGDGSSNHVGITGFDYYTSPMYFLARFAGTGTFVSAAAWTEEKNTVAQTDSTDTGAVNTNQCNNYIGAYVPPGTGLYFDGDIAEIILGPQMDGTQKTQMDAYMLCRYGL